MNILGRGVLLVISVGVTACTSTPATYQAPDYYETKNVPLQYHPGQARPIDELRCSQQKDLCGAAPQQDGKWISHRTYEKNYFFE